jgi:sec-independent protein translocase protein TatC
VVTGRRLLGWWRPAIFLMFLFGAVVTPTPDPFGMSILAVCMAALYFAAVGVALLHDRRKSRGALYADLSDDEASPLAFTGETTGIDPGTPVAAPEPVAPARQVSSGYDDFT